MKTMKKIISFVLCIAMIFCLCSCGKKDEKVPQKNEPQQERDTIRFTEEAPSVSKSETVFVSIDNSGKVQGTTVTDWIHTDKTEVRVTDVSDLQDITNVKTSQLPAKEGDNLVWNMDSTDVYYSGTTNKEAPVSLDISYYLDGKKMTAKEIAGKAGHAEIKIKVENNCFKTVKVNGKDKKIYLPVLVAGGTILQENEFSNINVESGFSLGDGTKQIAAAACAPGMCESLGLKQEELNELIGIKLSDTFVISADTTSFETTDFYFAAIPFCSLDVQLIAPKSASGLVENLGEIKKIFSSLENIDISSIIELLSGANGSTEEIISSVNSAIELYSKNEALLSLSSKYFTEDNIKTLSSAAKLLDDKDFVKGLSILSKSDIGSVAADLPDVAKSLESLTPILQTDAFKKALEILSSPVMIKFFEQLPEIAKSLSAIQNLIGNEKFLNALNALSDPSVSAVFQKMPELMKSFEGLEPLFGSIQKDLSDPQVQKCIDNLPETIDTINKLINTVNKHSGMINKLIDFASDKNVKDLIETLKASDIDTAELEKKLEGIVKSADVVAANAKEWIAFGKSYGVFTASTDNQKTNVVFVYNTPPIEKIAEHKKDVVEEKEHWYDRVINLFRKDK